MKSVPTNLPFPLLYGSVDLTLTSELISNLISYKPEFCSGEFVGTAQADNKEEIPNETSKALNICSSNSIFRVFGKAG